MSNLDPNEVATLAVYNNPGDDISEPGKFQQYIDALHLWVKNYLTPLVPIGQLLNLTTIIMDNILKIVGHVKKW